MLTLPVGPNFATTTIERVSSTVLPRIKYFESRVLWSRWRSITVPVISAFSTSKIDFFISMQSHYILTKADFFADTFKNALIHASIVWQILISCCTVATGSSITRSQFHNGLMFSELYLFLGNFLRNTRQRGQFGVCFLLFSILNRPPNHYHLI